MAFKNKPKRKSSFRVPLLELPAVSHATRLKHIRKMIGDNHAIYSVGVDLGYSVTNPTTLCLIVDDYNNGQFNQFVYDGMVFADQGGDPAARLLKFGTRLSEIVDDMYTNHLQYCLRTECSTMILSIEYPLVVHRGASVNLYQVFAATVMAFEDILNHGAITTKLLTVYPQQLKEYMTGSKVAKKPAMGFAASEYYKFNRGIMGTPKVQREGLVDAYAAAMVGRWLYLKGI